MKKEDYRYQFLRFETVGTKRYVVPKRDKVNPDNLEDALHTGLASLDGQPYEITKEVAVVFDKKLGVVKQVNIKELK